MSESREEHAPDPTETTLHALVLGRVQGVGFRFFVLRVARETRVGGATRNLMDGRVEVYARGPRDALEDLLAALHRGPFMSRVDSVEARWDAPPPPDMELPDDPDLFTVTY